MSLREAIIVRLPWSAVGILAALPKSLSKKEALGVFQRLPLVGDQS
jgi:hypothetical protein